MLPANDNVAESPSRYQQQRSSDIRVTKPWKPYAYHLKTLSKRLQALAGELRVGPMDSVIDYGCGEIPYREFFPPTIAYAAADLVGNPAADLVLSRDGTVPSPDNSFDALLSTQVLEHVTNPGVYLAEAYRVLRPGGRMLLSTHGVFHYHPDPDDYWRWTCAGLQRAVRDAGFSLVHFEGIIGLLPTGLHLVQDSIYWKLPRLLRAPFALVMQTLVALSDRLHNDQGRAKDAQVFGLVAEKPA